MGGLDGIDIILLDRTMLLKPDVELVDYHFQHEHYPEEIKVEQSKKKKSKGVWDYDKCLSNIIYTKLL